MTYAVKNKTKTEHTHKRHMYVWPAPPCPSFSTAGKRQSFDDPRGEVMFDFLRIVDEIRPPFFLMENVRGILSAAIKHVPLSERSAKGRVLTPEEKKGSGLRLLKKEFNTSQMTGFLKAPLQQDTDKLGLRFPLGLAIKLGEASLNTSKIMRNWKMNESLLTKSVQNRLNEFYNRRIANLLYR